jgi:hypothetical protein
MIQQSHRWRTVLRSSAGVSGIRLISKGIEAAASASTSAFTIFSDAAISDSFAGIGGWFHGYFWNYSLPSKLRKRLRRLGLGAAVLEFIANLVSNCTFLSLLPMPKAGTIDHHVVIRADASSTTPVQAQDRAKSEVMQELHLDALRDETYHAWLPALLFAHLYGIGNELADAASRADRIRLLRLAGQLQVSAEELQPHPILWQLLATVERALTPLESARDLADANTPTSGSFLKLTVSDAALRSFGLKARKAKGKHKSRREPAVQQASPPLPRRLALPAATQQRLSKGLKKAPISRPPIKCASSVASAPRRKQSYAA